MTHFGFETHFVTSEKNGTRQFLNLKNQFEFKIG